MATGTESVKKQLQAIATELNNAVATPTATGSIDGQRVTSAATKIKALADTMPDDEKEEPAHPKKEPEEEEPDKEEDEKIKGASVLVVEA
jgi:hypothetical protein